MGTHWTSLASNVIVVLSTLDTGQFFSASPARRTNGPADTANLFNNRALRAGWTAGAGVEVRLAGNITGKVEYLHTDFGFDKADAILPQNATPIAINFNSRIREDLVRLGINYKFADYGPIAVVEKDERVTTKRERKRPIYKGPVTALWTWTGFYFGANAGFAAGTYSTDSLFGDGLFASKSSGSFKGGIGGAQTGYNWQAGMWLAGLEADIQYSTQRIISGAVCPGAICNQGMTPFDVPVTVAYSHNLDWFGTVRGRVGALMTPDAVAYVTGGLAVGGIAHSARLCGFISDPTQNCTNDPVATANNFFGRTAVPGWTFGGGIEARLAGNVTGKVEYLRMNFGTASTAAVNGQITPPIAVALNSHDSEDIIRLGVNYKFDPNAEAPSSQQASVSKWLVPDKRLMIVKGPIAPVWTWTGYYLGINAGYSSGKASTDAFFNDNTTVPLTAFATNSSYGLHGRVLGLQTGYNRQFGSWLWGIEADLHLSGQRGTPTFVCPGTVCSPVGPVIAAFDQNQKLEWFGTLRARFGAAIARDVFAYVTGGAAVGGLLTSGDIFGYDRTGAPATNPFSNIAINAGWTVGGGIEARLYGNFTSKVEYLYMDFGGMTTGINNQQVMTLIAAFNSHVTDQLVRAGVNYKFD
jgi:outer membrane immunogenic protein